jgi:hypothetical protein
MKNILMTCLYFVISKFIQGTGSSVPTPEDITKLKLATIYLHAVKISRLLMISCLGSGLCLILFLTGLTLIHVTILFYAPWDVSVKVAVTLGCAAVYMLTAICVFASFFAEDKWMKMFNTEAIIKELSGPA